MCDAKPGRDADEDEDKAEADGSTANAGSVSDGMIDTIMADAARGTVILQIDR